MKKEIRILPFLLLPGLAFAQATQTPYPVIPLPRHSPALAGDSGTMPGSVDVYYIPQSELTLKGDFDGDGSRDKSDVNADGFGVRALVPVGASGMRLTGLYERVQYEEDGITTKLRQYRIGLDWMSQGRARAGGGAEYVNFNGSSEYVNFNGTTGYSAHLRGEFDVTPRLQLYGQAGALRVDGNDVTLNGADYLAGVSFMCNEWFGMFADYHGTTLKDDGYKYKLGDIRLGVRLFVGGD